MNKNDAFPPFYVKTLTDDWLDDRLESCGQTWEAARGEDSSIELTVRSEHGSVSEVVGEQDIRDVIWRLALVEYSLRDEWSLEKIRPFTRVAGRMRRGPMPDIDIIPLAHRHGLNTGKSRGTIYWKGKCLKVARWLGELDQEPGLWRLSFPDYLEDDAAAWRLHKAIGNRRFVAGSGHGVFSSATRDQMFKQHAGVFQTVDSHEKAQVLAACELIEEGAEPL